MPSTSDAPVSRLVEDVPRCRQPVVGSLLHPADVRRAHRVAALERSQARYPMSGSTARPLAALVPMSMPTSADSYLIDAARIGCHDTALGTDAVEVVERELIELLERHAPSLRRASTSNVSERIALSVSPGPSVVCASSSSRAATRAACTSGSARKRRCPVRAAAGSCACTRRRSPRRHPCPRCAAA